VAATSATIAKQLTNKPGAETMTEILIALMTWTAFVCGSGSVRGWMSREDLRRQQAKTRTAPNKSRYTCGGVR
jgi:hypothetical protein